MKIRVNDKELILSEEEAVRVWTKVNISIAASLLEAELLRGQTRLSEEERKDALQAALRALAPDPRKIIKSMRSRVPALKRKFQIVRLLG